MNLDTDLLRSFLAVVDCGNFTRAADRVGRTQSAVSMQMKRLEETLGKPLFRRDGRGVRLTDEGDLLVGYARRLIELNDKAIARFVEPEFKGSVRLGIPDDYIARFLPPVLAGFSQAHPLVELEVRTDRSVVLDAALASGDIDLALVSCKAVEDAGMVIHREPMVWVASSHHLVHERTPVPIATTDPQCQMRRNALWALDAAGFDYRVAYISPSFLGLQSFVQAGLAVAAIPESAVAPRMRVLGAAEGFPVIAPVDVGLKRARGPHSPAVEGLADALVESLMSAALLEA